MKHLKLFFALFAMLALGVGNAWAEDYSIKFLTAATDGSTEIATSTKTSTVLESASCAYVTGFTSNCTKAYYKGKSGVKLSSKNAAGTIELTLSNTCNQNISKVVFKTVQYSSDASTLTFYAGTSTLGTIAAGSDFSHTFTTPQSVSTLKIESSKRAYISEIIISVSAGETPGGGETPDPEEPDPTPGTGGESSTATFTYTDLNGQGASGSGADFTGATKENIHMSGKGNGNNSYVQIYANNYLTFTPTNATITKIVLTATSGYVKTWKASEGTIAVSGDKATWTGNSTSTITLTNTASAQARITQMDVTYTASGSGEPEPVIVKTLESIAVTDMTTTFEQGDVFKFDGTCTATYSVTKDGAAQADETAEVTPTNVSTPDMNTIGKQTVTVSYSEGGVDKTDEYEITITENTVTAGTYNVLLNNELWNVTAGQQVASVESMTGKTNDITFYTTKGSSQMYASATQTRFYKDATFVISVPNGYVIKSIVFTEPTSDKKWEGSISATVGTYDDGAKSWSGNAQEVIFSFAAQNRIANASITFEAVDLTLPSAPTFNPEAGTYNAVQNVTISAEEGATIYYTTDGTEPTNESTEYSSAIVLDQCGETTIQAIAISADNQSPVAKATYTIQLPIPTNSAVDPYTEAEAIDVYNSGCYDGEELVYVTGTVQTAQFYNSGTYTITLTGGMQFYYFYEGADEDVFESDYINEGDDIVACGKLSMYNTIYQLAKGCYLVKHKPVAQLSWSKSTCTAEIGGTNEFPTLTNTNSVAVSYSSSNTAAATINETTGEIALVAAGETTITATFAGNENYKANSASYTLTVAEAVVRGTITYNTNGGTEVAAQENQTNLPETLPTTTKAGYNFGGWYTDAECNTPAVANSVLTGDITLHAKWLEPYTVAQALAMNVTTGVYVKGIISTITEVNTDYKNATYKISDDGTTTSEMIVYRGKNVDNTDFTSEDQIAVGDIVVIYGNLSEYNSAIQLAQGNYIYSLTEPTLYTVTISFETNGGEPVESIEANTLPDPFPTTTKEGHAFDGWYMDNALTIPAVAGAPITTDADITLYAKWTEVSKWATTYTSNIEVGSDEVIINGTEYEAKKTGTSSAYGSTSVVVPVFTHTLHFHAAGWGADNLVNLVVKNGETVLGTFELSKDAGVKSNSPYTLAGTPYQQYYSVSLTNITAETTITFEASTSGGKRFVLYGVNQEGGIVPELNRIEIIGEATELTYEIGDVFNPAGLGVNAIYTLAGVDHETVAIDAEDVEWSFNPATIAAETSQVEVTATYMEKTATKTVAGLTINVPTPEITATPASIDWGTVNKDSEASKEVTVTLKAVANATISISGTNPEVFSVDKTALTEPGTIVVSANTSSVGSFTATITISDDAEVAEAEKISLSITVEPIDYVGGNWQLVTDAATLKAGDMVIIASVEVEGKYYTMGKQNSNNRAAIESTVSETQLTPTTGTSVLTLVDAGNGTFALQAGNGNYLYAASSSANQLKEKNKIDAHGQWTITIADNKATIKAEGSSNRNWMQFNPNNGSPLFSCYAYDKPQKDIALYKRMPDYTREVDPQYYGTICLPKAGKFVGGSLYEVAYYDETTKKVYFDEVLNGEMGAGMPYVFLANATKIEAYYTNDEEAAAQNKNGLCGTLVDITSGMNEDGVYMIYRNQIIHSTHSGSYLNANRAYIKLTEVPGYNDPLYVALAPAPGRKRIAIGQAPQVATGVDQVQGDNVPTKMIVNGQLFILRGEKMYDAQGKLVR